MMLYATSEFNSACLLIVTAPLEFVAELSSATAYAFSAFAVSVIIHLFKWNCF